MRDELRMAVLLITHDFGVVSMLADSVVVMYAGKQMEAGDADAVLRHPQHPYSAALLNSVRVLGARASRRLEQIPGEVPDVMRLPPGCSFRPALPVRRDRLPRDAASGPRRARPCGPLLAAREA